MPEDQDQSTEQSQTPDEGVTPDTGLIDQASMPEPGEETPAEV
jgi:hypothetical protein